MDVVIVIICFSAVPVFKKILFRIIDGKLDEVAEFDRERMLSIEKKTYGVIVDDVTKELGPWSGSIDQNRLADYKIAKVLWNSLFYYERNKRNDKKYFSFE